MRVVLDSNIFLSALLSPHGAPHRIYQAWQDERFELITATVQIEELRRASRYPKFHEILQPHQVGRMLNNLHGATVIERLPGNYHAADPDDAYLLALAIVTAAAFCQVLG